MKAIEKKRAKIYNEIYTQFIMYQQKKRMNVVNFGHIYIERNEIFNEKGIGKTKRNNINSLSYNNYSITNFSSNKHSN